MLTATHIETFATRHERGGSDWCVVIGRAYQAKNPPAGALD